MNLRIFYFFLTIMTDFNNVKNAITNVNYVDSIVVDTLDNINLHDSVLSLVSLNNNSIKAYFNDFVSLLSSIEHKFDLIFFK